MRAASSFLRLSLLLPLPLLLVLLLLSPSAAKASERGCLTGTWGLEIGVPDLRVEIPDEGPTKGVLSWPIHVPVFGDSEYITPRVTALLEPQMVPATDTFRFIGGGRAWLPMGGGATHLFAEAGAIWEQRALDGGLTGVGIGTDVGEGFTVSFGARRTWGSRTNRIDVTVDFVVLDPFPTLVDAVSSSFRASAAK